MLYLLAARQHSAPKMVCRLICVFLKTYLLVAFASGQCTNYKLQSNQYKRSSGYQLATDDVAISDNFLSEGWYRFKSGAGNDMVTSAPSLTKCGTIYPVWLNGSLPNIGDNIVNTTACVVGVNEECESKISIRIANCDSFNVYYLRRTPAFATGYCFGDQVKCPYGLGSENGFTPGCKSYLNISVSPNVAVDLEKGSVLVNGYGPSMISFFECAFNNPTNNMLYFDIIWYINEDEVRRTRNANYGNLSSTRLLPEHWVHQYNLNMVVRCAVRVRASAGGTPSNEMSSSNYQAGIFPESFIYHIKEGTTISIPFRVTYPVGCLSTSLNNTCETVVYLLTPFYQPSVDTCQNIPSEDVILFDRKQCGIILTRETWRNTVFLNVTGNIDNLINNGGDREIFIRIGILGKGSEVSRAWDNVTVPDIKVYISDMDKIISDRICKLQTDPRFWTFDGKRHDIYSAGEFVLYRHKKRSIEVHALFTACEGDSGNLGAACTCGVAIRVEDSLYVYRTCGLVSYRSVSPLIPHSAIYEICDDKHMVISTDDQQYTIISLPSGTRVKYKVHKTWIQHLHIIPSVFDIDNVEGICGNPNRNYSDDFVAPDGRTPISNKRADIDDIIDTWKVDILTASSLFSANPVLENTAHDRQKYCSCATKASDGNVLQDHAAVCNITKTIVECSHHQTTASFLTTCDRVGNTGRRRRALSEDGLSEKSKRVRRSTKDSDDVIDFVPLLLDPLYNSTYIPKIPTWRKGWNESIARQLCEENINNDPVKLECEKHIDIRNMINESISSCILDIRDSASTDWIAGTVDAIKSYCLTRISMYEKFYITNSSEEKPVVKIFKSVTCVNNCSTHGICTDDGKCLCDAGFIDGDCSHPINTPPENIVLPEEGLCRQSIRACAKTNIVGSFLSGTTIYVKLKIYKISMLGKGMVTNIVKTTAKYRAPNLITVELNSSSRNRKRSISSEYGLGFDISLSYDNTNFGEDLTFIIFDDSCYSCNSTTVSCTMLDSCLNIPIETSTRSSELSPSFSQDLLKSLNSFSGQGPRTTYSSLGATITEGSSAREGGATEEPPDLHQLQGKQRISESGKPFEFSVLQTNRGEYSCRGENETFPLQLGKVIKGSVGIRNSKRSQIRIHPDSPSPNKIIKLPYNFEREIPNSERRDRIYVREKSHLRSKPTKVGNRLHRPQFFGREKGRGRRTIINFRDLNGFMVYIHFKMEGINQVKDIIQQGDWLIKIDLKDAYFTIPIYKADQKYLRFPWEGKFYQFLCLPFGITVAPWVFTKLMKVPISYLRRLGLRMVIYLDEILVLNKTRENAVLDGIKVREILESLGFMINFKKSIFTPVQVIEFLGFKIDSMTMKIYLPQEKMKKIIKMCQEVFKTDRVSVRKLSEVIGNLTASLQAVH